MTLLPIELTCNVTGTVVWIVNNITYTTGQLANGRLSGHDSIGTNILVNNPLNNTEYICVSLTNGEINSDPAYIIIAGEYDKYQTTVQLCAYMYVDMYTYLCC